MKRTMFTFSKKISIVTIKSTRNEKTEAKIVPLKIKNIKEIHIMDLYVFFYSHIEIYDIAKIIISRSLIKFAYKLKFKNPFQCDAFWWGHEGSPRCGLHLMCIGVKDLVSDHLM